MKAGVQPIKCRYCKRPIPADVEPTVRENRPYCTADHAEKDLSERAKIAVLFPLRDTPGLFR